MMSNAIERQLPELTFDDLTKTIGNLAEEVTGALSERVSLIIRGDKTISCNRANVMQLLALCNAKIPVAPKERGEKIKEEGTEKLKKYQLIFEGNANLLDTTKKTLEYIAFATTFFSETMIDNQTTLSAKRKAQVEKDKANEKVTVCKNMLSFLAEQKGMATAMQITTQHNREGRKGEIYQLKQLEVALAPAKTWGGLVTGGLGWLWNRGGSKPTEVSTPVEGGAPAAAEDFPTEGVEKQASTEIPNVEVVTVSAIPTRLSFKDAVDQSQATTSQQGERPRIAVKRNLVKPK